MEYAESCLRSLFLKVVTFHSGLYFLVDRLSTRQIRTAEVDFVKNATLLGRKAVCPDSIYEAARAEESNHPMEI